YSDVQGEGTFDRGRRYAPALVRGCAVESRPRREPLPRPLVDAGPEQRASTSARREGRPPSKGASIRILFQCLSSPSQGALWAASGVLAVTSPVPGPSKGCGRRGRPPP